MDVSPLRESPDYRRLWIGTTLSGVGTQMTTFAVALQVFLLTHSSAAVGGIALVTAITDGTNSDYNGLQVKVTRRFQNGLSWTSGLAFQKAMGFVSSTTGLASFNFYLDPRRDYARTSARRSAG